jgi:VCBS repeat-containing protein
MLLSVVAPGVLGNDIDEDGNPLNALLVSNPIHGSLDLNLDGSFSYTPDVEFNGSDGFSYRASDGIAMSNITSVTLTVNAVNDLPLAVDDSYVLGEDTSLVVTPPGILTNDSDVDGDVLTATLVSGTSHGSLTPDAGGGFTYTPVQNYSGDDSFSYRATDGITMSNLAMVNITVTPINDPPVAASDSYSLDEDTALIIVSPGVLTNDSDVDGDVLNATVETGPSHGSLTLGAGGGFTFTPAQNYFGDDSFTYRASDGTAVSDPVTVTLTIGSVNNAPLAVDDTATTPEDTPVAIAVLENDIDLDGPSLTITAIGVPNLGTAVISGMTVLVTPGANLTGSDSFTYTVSDGLLQDTALVMINILPVNDAPLAVEESYTTDWDVALVLPAPGVLANDSDIEGDELTAILVANPLHGSLLLNVDGSFIYTPEAGYSGVDQFTYRTSDGSALSGVTTVNITIEAPPPPGTPQIFFLPIISG